MFKKLLPFSVALLTLAATPVQAAVTYIFAVPAGAGVHGFTWTTPAFVTQATTVPVASLSACDAGAGWSCGTPIFGSSAISIINPGTAPTHDVITFVSTTAFGSFQLTGFSPSYFERGAFAAIGIYHEQVVGNGATLTVSGAPSVPEPASWALMLTGFALTGSALRRRRGVVATA